MLARPAREITELGGAGELIPQNERETQTLRRERHAQR